MGEMNYSSSACSLSTCYFSQLLRISWKSRKILSSLIIDRLVSSLLLCFYTVTHLATTYALSLTTFDKLCEKQRPSGFSDRCFPDSTVIISTGFFFARVVNQK